MSVTSPVPASHEGDPLRLLKVVSWRVPAVDADRLEAVTIPGAREGPVLERVRDATDASELVYLPTCQRVLVALNTRADADAVVERARDAFASARPGVDVPTPEVFEGFEAFAHLSEVAASLDSLVPGETQILGQMKDAYKRAERDGLVGRAGRGLTHVFPLVFRTAKAVRTNTDLFKGKVSLIPLTLDLVKERLAYPAGDAPHVTVVGTGAIGSKMADLVRENVPDARVAFVSRTSERGTPLDAWLAAPGSADVVAFASRTDVPFFTADHARRLVAARAGAPVLLVDLSVPRCVADAARGVHGVTLVGLDDLTRLSDEAKRERRDELDRARAVLDAELARVADEYAKMPAARRLAAYRKAMDAAAEERWQAGAEKWGDLFADPEFRKWFEQTTRHLAHVAQERLHDAPVTRKATRWRSIRPTEPSSPRGQAAGPEREARGDE